MMKIKKIVSVLLLLALALGMTAPVSAESGQKNFSVVCTMFPQYDWVREIIGERADRFDLRMLLDSGVDLHNYQPSVQDIVTISNCDLFIYVGGLSDAWVPDVLKTAKNPNMLVIDMMGFFGDQAKAEVLVEGMEDHDHDDHDDHDGEDHDEIEYDEHVWLSIRNAEALCGEIAMKLGEMDPEGKAVYDANAAAYIEKLADLDARYADMVSASSRKTILFGDRFPFRYLADDYGLDYYAAFSGCSAESEASFETIVFLASKIDEMALPAVFMLEGTRNQIAETIVAATQNKTAQILTADSMQSITSQNIQEGITYLSIMEKNLEALRAALQ